MLNTRDNADTINGFQENTIERKGASRYYNLRCTCSRNVATCEAGNSGGQVLYGLFCGLGCAQCSSHNMIAMGPIHSARTSWITAFAPLRRSGTFFHSASGWHRHRTFWRYLFGDSLRHLPATVAPVPQLRAFPLGWVGWHLPGSGGDQSPSVRISSTASLPFLP